MKPYIQDSFRGAISDENDKGIAGSFKFGYALDVHKRDDSLTCKQAMVKVSGTLMTDLVRTFVAGADGTTYCFGASGSIYARSGAGDWTFLRNDDNGAIKGAIEWEIDDGNRYLIWCTNTSVARKLIPGDDEWGDMDINWRTTLTAADFHTMEMASGKVMIANGNNLAMIGYDGSFTPDALNLRPGNIIKALEERDDYCIMGSYRTDKSEKGHIWSWITTALNWVQKKKIPVKGINALIYAEIMLMQGGDEGELFFSDFVNAVPLHAFVGGGEVNPGGTSIEDDIAVFGAYGGTYQGIWSYGRKRKNRPFVLNYDYRLSPTVATGSTIVEIGAIEMVDGNLLASWKTDDGTTIEYGVDQVSSTTKAVALFESLEFDGGVPHMKKGYQIAKLVISPLPAGCSISMKYKIDKASSWEDALMGDGTTSFDVTDADEAEFMIPDEGRIYEMQITLNPSVNETPEILAVVTYINEESSEY